jgi:hypothetical protein
VKIVRAAALPIRRLLTVVLLMTTAPASANPFLVNMPPDTWYRAPRSRLLDATPATKHLTDKGIYCVQGPAAVVSSWSGGAYDSARHQMLVWGGGHSDYCGNEIYAFDLNRLRWQRLTEPSLPPFNRDPLQDGNPVSRHTYDGVQFVAHTGRLWAYGGARAYDGDRTTVTWTFDPDTRHWTNMAARGHFSPGAGHVANLSSGYDPVSRRIYIRDPMFLYAYDVDENTWHRLKDWPHSWGQQRGIVDPTRRLYFTVGMGEFQVYDIAAGLDVTAQWQSEGGSDVIAAPAPGVDYDPLADALVAWIGGAIRIFDLKTKTWSSKSATGAPPAQNQHGTFGRFRYVPEYNVFVLINAANDDVYFYKHLASPQRTHTRPNTQP